MPAGPPYARYRGEVSETADVEVGFPVVGEFSDDGEVRPSELPTGQ